MDDTISRAAALDALGEEPPVWYDGEDEIAERNQWRRDVAAIKALPPAQPTGTKTVQVDDCISRAAIVDAIEGVDWYHMTDSGEMVHGANSAEDQPWYKAEDIYAAIEALPSAQTERKKGKWIERNPRNSPDCRLIECSECGNAYIVGYSINYDDWIDGRNFCMKCGADLRGGSNGKST